MSRGEKFYLDKMDTNVVKEGQTLGVLGRVVAGLDSSMIDRN